MEELKTVLAKGRTGTLGYGCGTWGWVDFEARRVGRTQNENTTWDVSLTTQVDSIEQNKAGVGGQTVQQLGNLVVGVLSHPLVDELQVGITVIAQDSGAAAIQTLRGAHKNVPYGQV